MAHPRLACPAQFGFLTDDKLSPARYPDLETGQTLGDGWVHVSIDMVVQPRSEKASPRTEGHLPFVGMDDIETDGLTIAQTALDRFRM
jgi:hypothetical protein